MKGLFLASSYIFFIRDKLVKEAEDAPSCLSALARAGLPLVPEHAVIEGFIGRKHLIVGQDKDGVRVIV